MLLYRCLMRLKVSAPKFCKWVHVPSIVVCFSSPASDLAARRGVFSRRHYGSVETVSWSTINFNTWQVLCDVSRAVRELSADVVSLLQSGSVGRLNLICVCRANSKCCRADPQLELQKHGCHWPVPCAVNDRAWHAQVECRGETTQHTGFNKQSVSYKIDSTMSCRWQSPSSMHAIEDLVGGGWFNFGLVIALHGCSSWE